MKQLDFLDLIEPQDDGDVNPFLVETEPEKLQGRVWQLPSGNWQAIINSGWWSATAPDKEKAIQRVKKMYWKETGRIR